MRLVKMSTTERELPWTWGASVCSAAGSWQAVTVRLLTHNIKFNIDCTAAEQKHFPQPQLRYSK